MNRREVLRLLGGAAAIPVLSSLSPATRLALGRSLHRRLERGRLRTLNGRENALVTRIADLIIPETDTPGAVRVNVPAFIDLLLSQWYAPADRQRLLAGLEAIDARSRAAHGASFVELAPPDQAALLRSLDGREGVPGGAEDAFATLKELTVYGYFTSEVVVKDVLKTRIIPGRHDACIPV
jgi:hypothetical protein